MKCHMRFYCFIVVVFIVTGCRQDLHDSMVERIKMFERNENRYFENMMVTPLRNAKRQNPLEMSIHRKGVFGKAYIQVSPDHIILRNFPHGHDSIQLDVVQLLDSLKIRGLSNFGDSTELEFWHKQDYVVLYRVNPYRRLDVFRNSTTKEVWKSWRYFTFKLKSD